MTQLSLLEYQPPRFHGSTFSEGRDGQRLGNQLAAVLDYMLSESWVTLNQIHKALGVPEASASARLRDLRRHGYTVERQRVKDGNGLHRYRLTKGMAA